MAAPGRFVLVGIDGVGGDVENELMTRGRVLPWLQDRPEVDVWKKWGVEYRDVILVDAQNHAVGVYNLSAHDLATQSNYDELKAMLLGVP